MTEQISPLRQRMIDDMVISNMSPNTQKAYIRAVRNFSRQLLSGILDLTDIACWRSSILPIDGTNSPFCDGSQN